MYYCLVVKWTVHIRISRGFGRPFEPEPLTFFSFFIRPSLPVGRCLLLLCLHSILCLSVRYLEVGGGQVQDSQFMTLIKEEPEDAGTAATAAASAVPGVIMGKNVSSVVSGGEGGSSSSSSSSSSGGGGGGGLSGPGELESKSAESSSPEPSLSTSNASSTSRGDTNTSSLLSALADVRELYYEHS